VDLDRRAITCRGPDYDAAVARGLKHFETNCSDLFFRLFFFDFDVSPITTLEKNNWCSPGSCCVFPIAPGTCIHVALGCEVHEKWPGDSWGRQSPSLSGHFWRWKLLGGIPLIKLPTDQPLPWSPARVSLATCEAFSLKKDLHGYPLFPHARPLRFQGALGGKMSTQDW
jgi:hypothetical protein